MLTSRLKAFLNLTSLLSSIATVQKCALHTRDRIDLVFSIIIKNMLDMMHVHYYSGYDRAVTRAQLCYGNQMPQYILYPIKITA